MNAPQFTVEGSAGTGMSRVGVWSSWDKSHEESFLSQPSCVCVSPVLPLEQFCKQIFCKIPAVHTKAKAYNTYIAPQAAYCSCNSVFMSQSGRSLLSLHLSYAALACHNPCNYMDDPGWMEGWVGLVGWPI